MISDTRKSPFPWFGGKSDAAEYVWRALGDVDHYCEPFAGSLAVLLRRPHQANRAYHSETVNDLDGLIVNAWRSIMHSPRETAEACSWPVTEVDLTARHLAIVRWREAGGLLRLMSDPDWHDAKMAGWWIWGLSSWIGSGWCSGTGPWYIGDDGIIRKRERSEAKSSGSVSKQLPHLGNDGRGCNSMTAREVGVSKKLPHLGDDGQGCNSMTAREVGVGGYHPMLMPELLRWFEFLSARLRHVRIIQGDWTRALTPSASKTLSVRTGDGVSGIFLDPPYSTESDRAMSIYTEDCGNVAHDVRAWRLANGNDPKYRIVLAGYDTEHAELEAHGWTVIEWFKAGFLKGGMGKTGKVKLDSEGNAVVGGQQKRERLWMSPHCIGNGSKKKNMELFE